jgi:dTDP-4-amino-4,6-dideoxygalactose transaminase
MDGTFIPLTAPYIDDDDIRQMEKAVRAKAVSQGGIAESFESAFADLLGAKGAVAVNSCTSALILALRTLGVGSGDEVILPSYTCLAVLNAVMQTGATPRLVDNNYDTERMDYNISEQAISNAISDKTKAIIVPHMFGVAAEVDRIITLGVPVIEDVTLSLGLMYKGRIVGSFGQLSVCSFHTSKMITTGEGGMLTASTPVLYKRVAYLNGWECEQAAARLKDADNVNYELRYNFHLSDILASLGLSQLAKLKGFITRRRELARLYSERLSRFSRLRLPDPDRQDNVFFRYLVGLPDGIDVAGVIEEFLNAQIEVGRGVYPSLHNYLRLSADCFPNAERAMRTLLSIPLYPALTDEQVEHILRVSEKVFREEGLV